MCILVMSKREAKFEEHAEDVNERGTTGCIRKTFFIYKLGDSRPDQPIWTKHNGTKLEVQAREEGNLLRLFYGICWIGKAFQYERN